jgi:glyoxylase-like metal-dependent hydrolase (beta-lactamase superfamily II)
MKIEKFFDENTATFSYIVIDETTQKCAIIDSIMDYDHYSGSVSYKSADAIIAYIKKNNLKNEWILETHIHADHISAAYYLQDQVGGKTGIGKHISEVLKFWVGVFETQNDTPLTGEQFDVLFDDGDSFKIGNLNVKVIHTPGHTPACICYLIEDSIFVGDTIFSPYVGTARCDFPGGSAELMYDSIQKIYALPDNTTIYLCHDYPSSPSELLYKISIREQKLTNSMIKATTTKEEFVEARETKDYGRDVPKLIIPSVQSNMRGGSLGKKSSDGVQFIKIPINILNKDIGDFKKITSKYYYTTNLPTNIADIKNNGFNSIIYFDNNINNNFVNLAKDNGLSIHIINIDSSLNLSTKNIEEFKHLYNNLNSKILGVSQHNILSLDAWRVLKGKK